MAADMKICFATKGQPKCTSSSDAEAKLSEKSVFVNHAAVAWHENRRKWVGDQSDKSKRVTKEPVIWYNFSVEKFPLGDITISIFAKIDPWIFHMQLVDGL